MVWYTTEHARRDAERQAARRQQAGSLDKAQSSKQVTAQGAECAAKGSGPCSIGQHGPRGAYRDGDFKPYQAWQLVGRGVGEQSRKVWQCRVCGYVVTVEREPSNRITLKGL